MHLLKSVIYPPPPGCISLLQELFVENKKLERERAETIETIKNFFGTAIPLAIIAVVIYFIYYIFSESGILSALLDLFSSVGN